jgi:hypothetical protein
MQDSDVAADDRLMDLCYTAWTIIANAGEGNWDRETPEWSEADGRWRDRYHAELASLTQEDTDEVPEFNGRHCPYYARHYELGGYRFDAICIFGCVDEPECVTCEPAGGWPS